MDPKQRKSHANLLLISEENGNRHYCLIKNKSRLFSKQGSKRKRQLHMCDYCHEKFGTEKLLNEHVEYCSQYDCVKTFFPKDDNSILKFKNYEKMHDVPFDIYADFECILNPIDKDIGENTKQFQKH